MRTLPKVVNQSINQVFVDYSFDKTQWSLQELVTFQKWTYLCILNKKIRGWYPKSCGIRSSFWWTFRTRDPSFRTRTHDPPVFRL